MLRWLSATCLLSSTLLLAGPFGCPVSHVDTCEAQLRAICEFQFRCCDAEERLTGMFRSFPYVANEGECVDRIVGYCKSFAAAQDDAVAAGRLKFNGDKARECVVALEAARDSCDIQAFAEASDGVEDDPGPCAEVSEGLVEEGDACADDNECADDEAFCEVDNDDPELNEELGTRDGECVGPGGPGDDCSERGCRAGLECTYDMDSGDFTCVAPPGLGEPCPDGSCQQGLACGYDSGAGEYLCRQPAGAGEDCSAGGVCAEPLVCIYDDVTYQQTCQDPPGIGEPCPSYECATGAFCNYATGSPLCQAQVAPGGECDPNLFDQCAGDTTYCDDSESPPVCVDYDDATPVDSDQCNGN